MIRVVIVDDHALMRAGMTMLVDTAEDITVVAEADNGQEALAQARTQCPDVILMDVRMPGTDGVEATRAIIDEGLTAQNGQPIKIIILTTFHLDEYVHAALRAGASGFLLKSAAPTEIVAAIRAVVAGKAWLDPAVTRRLIDDFATRPEQPMSTSAEIAQLTRREREVLIHLAQGLSNADVARKLFISEATVKTHLAHVMSKLGVNEKAQAVIAAYRTGLVQPPSPRPGPSQ
ncbi:MAG TPA: response regulator transcription factor [Pseudonocardiaceae bacterium]|nr:response regulator transcription factor [Pseudonocardiaceae bacterium]